MDKPCMSFKNLCEILHNNYPKIKNGYYSLLNSESVDNNIKAETLNSAKNENNLCQLCNLCGYNSCIDTNKTDNINIILENSLNDSNSTYLLKTIVDEIYYSDIDNTEIDTTETIVKTSGWGPRIKNLKKIQKYKNTKKCS